MLIIDTDAVMLTGVQWRDSSRRTGGYLTWSLCGMFKTLLKHFNSLMLFFIDIHYIFNIFLWNCLNCVHPPHHLIFLLTKCV